MRALTATVQIVLDPEVIGPDALTEWGGDLADANACDYLSSLLSESESETILDWRYVRENDAPPDFGFGWRFVEVEPKTYEEGDAFAFPFLQEADTLVSIIDRHFPRGTP